MPAGSVPQDQPLVVFRFAPGEPADPVDLASFAVVVDDSARTALFHVTQGEAWGRLGFVPADWETGGSDRLIDEICAWGDAATVHHKLAAFRAAGASHVVLYACNPHETYTPTSAISKQWDWRLFESLAALT